MPLEKIYIVVANKTDGSKDKKWAFKNGHNANFFRGELVKSHKSKLSPREFNSASFWIDPIYIYD